MRSLVLILFAVLITSCGSVRVNYDYDKSTDFSNFNTYRFYSKLNTGLNEIDEKRLLNIMDITLQIKGMVYSEEPDFLIKIENQIPQQGQDVAVANSQNQEQKLIRFEFLDIKRNHIFWTATCQTSFKENESALNKEEKLAELVDKMLSKYPPKSHNK
ncbi:DUF4136 domain-containing protein [Aurantibacter sp.]|uniref:DUF4136 domain-containing protein n=1 Tax=Aurantibacter sp. TaxID=2807103 RepID=UPI003267FA85